jgi:hypothetical protein
VLRTSSSIFSIYNNLGNLPSLRQHLEWLQTNGVWTQFWHRQKGWGFIGLGKRAAILTSIRAIVCTSTMRRS